jgi:micrococcal nuclease
MKSKLVILFILLILASSCTTESNLSKEGPYRVTNVVDGDTLDALINGETERIRLSGINTPEKGDCYYTEAKDELTNLVLNKYVYLEQDRTDRGKYGRLLRYIYIENKLINEELVKEGYAKVFDKYKDDTKYYLRLKSKEDMAKQSSLGVWNC